MLAGMVEIAGENEFAERVACNVLALLRRIEEGAFARAKLDELLLLELHACLCADVAPALAGWRTANFAREGNPPPDFTQVPALVNEYCRDLRSRLDAVAGAARLDGPTRGAPFDALAFAEARFLYIRPFAAFNGRATRLWLREILRRLDLPPVQLAPLTAAARGRHLAALRAHDRGDPRALADLWRERFEAAWCAWADSDSR